MTPATARCGGVDALACSALSMSAWVGLEGGGGVGVEGGWIWAVTTQLALVAVPPVQLMVSPLGTVQLALVAVMFAQTRVVPSGALHVALVAPVIVQLPLFLIALTVLKRLPSKLLNFGSLTEQVPGS